MSNDNELYKRLVARMKGRNKRLPEGFHPPTIQDAIMAMAQVLGAEDPFLVLVVPEKDLDKVLENDPVVMEVWGPSGIDPLDLGS